MFGQRPYVEIDLLARDLRLAVEIDGYYHFRDPQAFRRDRRKDWVLQKAGYVVLRFLAGDVINRQDAVVCRVLEAVRHQRQHARRTLL